MTNEMQKQMEITWFMGLVITGAGLLLGSNVLNWPIQFHDANWQLLFYIGLFILLLSKIFKFSVWIKKAEGAVLRQWDFYDFIRSFLDIIELIIYSAAISNLFSLELLWSFIIILACYLAFLIITLIHVHNSM